MKFLDQAKINLKAGNGGSGSASFRRENMLSLAGLTEEMVVMEVQFYSRLKEI